MSERIVTRCVECLTTVLLDQRTLTIFRSEWCGNLLYAVPCPLCRGAALEAAREDAAEIPPRDSPEWIYSGTDLRLAPSLSEEPEVTLAFWTTLPLFAPKYSGHLAFGLSEAGEWRISTAIRLIDYRITASAAFLTASGRRYLLKWPMDSAPEEIDFERKEAMTALYWQLLPAPPER